MTRKGGFMAIEFELKFRATAESIQAIDRAVSGIETRFSMETTYYDGVSGQLSAKKYTLRRRLENDISVCTLKLPAGENRRGEWEVQCDDIQKAIDLLVQMGAPEDLKELTTQGITEVCGAKFDRIAKTLEFDGAVLELALDQGILTGGGRQIPLCEVEVELKSGEPKQAEQYAKILAAKFGLTPERHSKFRRAFDLYKGEI